MNLKIKAFGATRDIVGGREFMLDASIRTVEDLRGVLTQKYPKLAALKSLFIAVNNSYSEDTMLLRETDEVALIPPVSGG